MARLAGGINFKLLKEPYLSQLLQCLVGKVDLQSRCDEIGRCLLGHNAIKKIAMSQPSHTQSNVKENVLFEALWKWCQEAETATGSELLQHLNTAGCCITSLSEVKDIFVCYQSQAQLEEMTVDRPTLRPPHSTEPFTAQYNVPAQPSGSCISPEVMSQVQGMIQATIMPIQNGMMQTFTTVLDQFREGFMTLQGQYFELQAEMKEIKSKARPARKSGHYARTVVAPMPGEKAFCQAVHLRGKLVVVGGFKTATQPCTRVFVQSITSGEWYESEPTPHALSSVAADSDGSKMYIIGGCGTSGGPAVDTVFAVSSDLRQTVPLPKLIRPCCRAASTVHQGRLYVLGGEASWYENEQRRFYGQAYPYHMQILNLDRKVWTHGPELMHESPWLDCYRLVSLGSRLICDRRHVFDTSKMAWDDHDLPHRPSGYSTAMSVVDNRLLVFGGVNEIKHVDELSDDMQSWRQVGEMTTPRRHATACTVGDSVYIVGGQSGNFFFNSVESFSCVEV